MGKYDEVGVVNVLKRTSGISIDTNVKVITIANGMFLVIVLMVNWTFFAIIAGIKRFINLIQHPVKVKRKMILMKMLN